MDLTLSEPQPETAALVPSPGLWQRVIERTLPTSGPNPWLDGSSQGNPEVFASHFASSSTTPPPELKALLKWA